MDTRSSSVKFNDIFGNKADYTKGLFYEARRKYLKYDDSLEPPNDLKTKGQMRRFNDNHRVKVNNINMNNSDKFHLLSFHSGRKKEEPKSEVNQPLTKAAARRYEAAAKSKAIKPQTQIIIQKYSSTSPEDWQELFQAGCHIWVKKSTGEVSTVCPWVDTEPEEIDSNTTNATVTKSNNEQDEESDGEIKFRGTGAMVYDGSEVNSLLKFLDRLGPDDSSNISS